MQQLVLKENIPHPNHNKDVVDDHKIKMEKMRLKIRKIRKYAIDSVAWYHYAVGSIVTLVAILIAVVVK